MAVPGISSSSFSAIAAGLQAQMRAQVMTQVLDATGLLEPDLAAALQQVDADGQAITAAGVTLAGHDMLGTLFDAVA